MKIVRPAILFVFIGAMTVPVAREAVAQDSARPAEMKSGDWDMIFMRPFYLANCVWGKGGITDYEQYIYKKDRGSQFPVGWKWRWPALNTEQVKSYPDISFGKNPWAETSTSPDLPRRIDAIKKITAAYDIASETDGRYNLAFDLWITKTPDRTDPPEANIVREVMIWLDHQGECLPRSWFVKEVVFDGEKYDLYIAKQLKTGPSTRDYLAFVKQTPEHKGETNIHVFLQYLAENNHISPTEYFRNIDLGNEIWYGSGATVIHAYSISIMSGGD